MAFVYVLILAECGKCLGVVQVTSNMNSNINELKY